VAAEILETHPRTLMLYEDANLIEPFRTPTNRRRYSQRDISKVQVIQHLTREKGRDACRRAATSSAFSRP